MSWVMKEKIIMSKIKKYSMNLHISSVFLFPTSFKGVLMNVSRNGKINIEPIIIVAESPRIEQ